MSAAVSMARAPADGRKFPRHPINVALDVIALRSGVPENLPGRSTDLSEGGVGAMVAGELAAGQQVAVELRLPNVGVPLRVRALVRYQGRLRYGFEFVGLPADEREMIRYWAYRLPSQLAPVAVQPVANPEETETMQVAAPATAPIFPRPAAIVPLQRLGWIAGAVVLVAILGWWRWQSSWSELETNTSAAQMAPLRVSPETMEMRIVSKVDPIYPEQARLAGKQGLVVLDAVIAADGTVEQVRPLSGDNVLAKAAVDAVRRWKFEPYQSSGRATRVETTLAVEFRLN
jgi:TonB family protein